MSRRAQNANHATRPSLQVTRAARARPGLRFAVVLGLSVALHVGLAMAFWEKPLGFMGAQRHDDPPRVTRVRRATYDYFISDRTDGAASRETSTAPSAAEVSRALLKEQPSRATAKSTAPTTPRDTFEDRFNPDTDEPSSNAANPPADEALYQSLVKRAPQAITEAPGDGRGGGEGTGDGTGGGSGEGSGGAGSSAARQLLAEAGAAPNVNPQPPAPDPAPLRDRAERDQRLMETSAVTAATDVTESALVDTTKLNIPTHLDDDFRYYLSRYDPPDEPGYFRVDIAARQSLRKLPAMPKDVIFLVDTSGSISDKWVKQIVAGVKQSLPNLNEGDRFNIVFFDEQPRFFSTDGMKPANPATLNEARTFLEGTGSEGFTNVNAALRQLLVRDVEPNRVYEIILLSDGKPTRGVMNTRELINRITRDNRRAASIYCLGVGREQNRELLDFLAYRNKGFSHFVTKRDKAAQQIARMMRRLRYPLIKNVQLRATGVDETKVFPRFLPNIHQGQTHQVFGRYSARKEFTMRLTGRAVGKEVDFTFTGDLSLASPDDRQIARGWAFWKLHHLYSEIIRRGESKTLKQQIDQLQQQYDLETVY